MKYLLLLLLLTLFMVLSYSVVVPVVVVNTTNCSYYFPNITNNTTYFLLDGTYNYTECGNLNLTNKYNVTFIGESEVGVDLYNLTNGYTLEILNSHKINFTTLSISETTNDIYVNNSSVSFNSILMYVNKTTIGYSMFNIQYNSNIYINNSYLYLKYIYQIVFEYKGRHSSVFAKNTYFKSTYGDRLAYRTVARYNKIVLQNSNVQFYKGCYVDVDTLIMNNSSITSNGVFAMVSIQTNYSYINDSNIQYYYNLYIYSNILYIINTTLDVISPISYGYDQITGNYTYFVGNRYYNYKTTLLMNGSKLIMYNNTLYFNTSFSYIINTLDNRFYVFYPVFDYNIIIAKNNTVNDNLSIGTCGSNKTYYELILDNCSSNNTTSYFVTVNTNSSNETLENSKVLLLIYNPYNLTLKNDNITFVYSNKSGILKLYSTEFRTLYTKNQDVYVYNSKTRLSNVSYNVYLFTSFRPTTIALNTSDPILCSEIYANGYQNTLLNNSFDIVENNTNNYVYNSKLCGGNSSFKILYGDKVYAYSSYLNNYTVDVSLIILNNTSNIWIPTLPDNDYFCNGTKMYIQPVKHHKKKKKHNNVKYVNKIITLTEKRSNSRIPGLLIIIIGILIILRSLL